ncbi:MAG: LEPR-XLL domain-containing protein, partial [Burkholderiales bacterium]|nr:LEPR-XLL domain-containing protein [Burkholderiales bacterium]
MPTLARLFQHQWLSRSRGAKPKPGPQKIPFRRNAMFEALEPRLLLSADIASPAIGDAAIAQRAQQDLHVHTQTVLPEAPTPIALPDADFATGNLLSTTTVTVSVLSNTTPPEAVQWIHVDLDGAEDIVYDGPVRVEGLDIAALVAPAGLEGQEGEIAATLIDALNGAFRALPVRFTLDAPTSGPFSTVYVGGDGAAFSQWGHYIGLAEQVDTGNADRSDNALVFSENITTLAESAGEYGRLLAAYVAHEVGHLLGLEHAHEVDDGSDPLAEVAFKPYTHVEIARDVLADLTDDGKLVIEGHEYDVHPLILEALTAYPDQYFAGTVGPDGFPDFVMGQSVIHPMDTGTWATRVLDMAWKAQTDPSFTTEERKQILAWSYGFLTHAAGDHWAHTLVNEFAEGVFPDFLDIVTDTAAGDTRALSNALRHFLVEGFIGDATPGFDNNPDRGPAPGGDVSDDSTPGIPYGVPTRFVYETLIRPFAGDPSFLADTGEAEMSVDAAGNRFIRTDGDFADDGFVVGQRITVAGFAANNGVFTVPAAAALQLRVAEDLVAGDETPTDDGHIVVRVPYTPKTTLTVDAANNQFERAAGSFLTEGFVVGQRFSASGFAANNGDYRITAVTANAITVDKDLVAGDEAGSGDEQLAAQGKRGLLMNKFLDLRYELEKQVEGKARGDFGVLVADVLDKLVNGVSIPPATLDNLFTAYLYNWIDNIDAGLANWGDFGLAITKAMFDAQARRDLQNEVGATEGDEDDILRENAENGVGLMDVVLEELDDPNGDGYTGDSFINVHLLPMLGVPNELAFARTAMQSLGTALQPITDAVGMLFNPLQAAVAELKEAAANFVKDQVKERFGFDFETFDYLTNLAAKMDLQSIEIGSVVVPVFPPGAREKLEAYLGLSGDLYEDPPAGFDAFPGVEFYDDAVGPLNDNVAFDKAAFPAYANSVVLGKLLLLSEDPVDGATVGAGQLSQVMSDVLTDLNGGITVGYDFGLLNLNGAHGGNILTSTLPGIADASPWLTSIDQDHGWRADSLTTTTLQYRVNTESTGTAKAVWQASVAAGNYAVQASWLANVTQGFDAATAATYRIFDGATLRGTVTVNQRNTQSNDLDADGLGFENLGTFNIASGNLRIELENAAASDGSVIAGPVRFVAAAGGAAQVVRLVRDPETLVVTPSGYSETGSGWVDLNYPTGMGSGPINPKFPTGTNNFPLWESEMLRPVYRALFTDWQNGSLNFPSLGDVTSDDPNTTPGIAADPIAAYTNDFGPQVETPEIEIPVPESVRDALLDGIAELIELAEGLGDPSSPLGIQLPLIDRSLADIIDLDGRLRTSLQLPLQNYFDNDATPTFGELFDVLGAALPGRLDSIESIVEFDFDLLANFVENDIPLDLGAEADGLGIALDASATVDLAASVGFADALNANLPKFSFGVDLSQALSDPLDAFYIKADRLMVGASASADDVDFGARIGFLGAGIVDGDIALDADVSVVFNDPNSDGRITGAELAGTPVADLLTVTPTGSFTANLPLEVQTGLGIDPDVGTIVLSATDLFDTGTYDAEFTGNFDQFGDFTNLTADDLMGLLQQFVTQIDDLKDTEAMQALFGLPVAGAVLEDVFDFADLVSDTLLYDDFDDADPATGIAKLLDADGNPTFTSAQGFAEKLAQILGLDPSAIGANYDAATKLLTFNLRIEQTLVDEAAPLDLAFDLESGLADFEASTDASVDASFVFEFGLGIDLDFDPATEDLADHVFIEDASLTGTLNLEAADIDAAARFGFLGIAVVDGSATGTATLNLSLTDPGTNAADGRINIAEFVGGADLDELFDASLTGSVAIDLPVSAPFLGIAPGPDTTISLQWANIADPDSITFTFPNLLEASVANFTNMDAGTLVSLLGQITAWLNDFATEEGGFAGLDIPVIGDALKGILELGDIVQDRLLFDDNDT